MGLVVLTDVSMKQERRLYYERLPMAGGGLDGAFEEELGDCLVFG